MAAPEKNSTGIGSFLAGLGNRAGAVAGAPASDAEVALITAAILESPDVARIIRLQAVQLAADELLVGAKIDVSPDLTMRQVSVIVNLAERRVREALPAATSLFISADVWIDPDAVQPTTSAVVLLSGN